MQGAATDLGCLAAVLPIPGGKKGAVALQRAETRSAVCETGQQVPQRLARFQLCHALAQLPHLRPQGRGLAGETPQHGNRLIPGIEVACVAPEGRGVTALDVLGRFSSAPRV